MAFTIDEVCETLDEFGQSGDTPIRIKLDGEFYDLTAIHTEPDGTVTFHIDIEEA